MAELLDRAQALVAAGPYDARAAEIAAVHDGIWPEKAPVCPTLTCRRVLGVAYFSIKRWAEQQDAASDAPLSLFTIKKNVSVARFKSSNTIYTPHGLGIAYSNDNLTDKVARYILENDPDAKVLFSELPPEASKEDGQASPATEPASAPAVAAGEIDYTKLAQAIVDIQNKNKAQEPDQQVKDLQQEVKENSQPLPSATAALTASAGGATEAEADTTTVVETETLPNGVVATTGHTETTDEDHSDDKPVRLSRMGKDQLLTAYRTELRLEPAEGLTNDELRNAIAEHRASQQDPE